MQDVSRSEAAYRPDHYHAIDVLRGLAAIAVLVFHYQHFYYPIGTYHINVPQVVDQFPLHEVLAPIYFYGNGAVQIFWMISGLVFANVYAGKHTPAGEFAVKRLARLYPLHFVTLIIVAVMQLFAVGWFGTSLIYENNDPYHFVLNLFLASTWGFEDGFSFNGPIWSVSVEVLIYMMFWVVARHLLRMGVVGPLFIAALAGVLYAQGLASVSIWQCAQYFFIGCALFHVASSHARPVRDLAIVIAGAMVGMLATHFSIGLDTSNGLLLFAVVLVSGAAIIDLHPSASVLRRLRFVGDSTYGIYLWHVPLQLAALLLLDSWGLTAAVRGQPLFLLLYLATCCIAGWLSFVWFEKPANRAIVRMWKQRRTAAMPAPPSPNA